jgi:peroxiredoxin
MSELQGLQLKLSEFTSRNCSILALVVDSPGQNASVVRDLDLGFPVLSDRALKVIDAYGLRHPGAGPGGHDIARPASFLIDADGIIRWRDLTDNYRIRPHPDVILAELDKLKK